ncbi:MAG: class I SAM-dependent methyltransferase [Candidatus Heimdallarchaeota archaeon]
MSNDFEYLKKLNFLQPEDLDSSIQENLHLQAIWADVFWRRRHNHTKREDPELKFIFDRPVRQLLEIGAGYGRILRKIAHINQKRPDKTKLVGIEICSHFNRYFDVYREQHPVLNDVEILFDDFLTTTKLKTHSFDVILLPMNTFPNLPFKTLRALFSAVKRVLHSKGIWIFSTYKMPSESMLFEFIDKRSGFFRELLGDLGEEPIAAEYYTMKAEKMSYGARTITYMCYNSFTRGYELKKREIFRTVQEYILPGTLEELILKNGFSIAFQDESSHSAIYGLTPV